MDKKQNQRSNSGNFDNMITETLDQMLKFTGVFLLEFTKVLWLMLKEFIFAMRHGQVPWVKCLLACLALHVMFRHYWDFYLFKWIGWTDIYPGKFSRTVYLVYRWSIVAGGFWGWLFYRICKRRGVEKKFEEAFTCAGLKNKLGQLPKFLSRVEREDGTVVARFTNAGFPKERFEEQKDYIESTLGVFVDSVKEDRQRNTVEIVYSKEPLTRLFEYHRPWAEEKIPNEFPLGRTRSELFTCYLTETPHLLVAGETSSGKSTFLRHVITTLYCNNPNMEFTLFDFKSGLEFSLFENLPRVTVVSEVNHAVKRFKGLEEELEKRMRRLTELGVKDISSLKSTNAKMGRHLVVIDEAAELFLPGLHNAVIKPAAAIVSKLARQGRAAGIHLIIGTQRPDARALDTQIKANLVGKICFQIGDQTSSLVVLGNTLAKDLPSIPGRAIWQKGLSNTEIQTPFLSDEEASDILSPFRSENKASVLREPDQDSAAEGW